MKKAYTVLFFSVLVSMSACSDTDQSSLKWPSRAFDLQTVDPDGVEARWGGEGGSGLMEDGTVWTTERPFVQNASQSSDCAASTVVYGVTLTPLVFNTEGAVFAPDHRIQFISGTPDVGYGILGGGRLNVLEATDTAWEFEIVDFQLCVVDGETEECTPDAGRYWVRLEGDIVYDGPDAVIQPATDMMEPTGGQPLCVGSFPGL